MKVSQDRLFALVAPVFWSITGVTIRHIDTATEWQINFYRSSSLMLFVLCVLVLRYRARTLQVIAAAGWTAVVAGLFVGGAMIANIVALTHTTVANAVLLMASGPIFAAGLGWLFLKERINLITWAAMLLAVAGIVVMVSGNVHSGGLFGDLVALAGVGCFGAYATTLRYGRHVDMTPAVLHAGVFGTVIAAIVSAFTGVGLAVPLKDALLCMMLGVVQLGIGSVLFAIAARSIPAVELTLYALVEPLLAPIWSWIGAGEIPTTSTFIGGGIMLLALLLHVAGQRRAGT